MPENTSDLRRPERWEGLWKAYHDLSIRNPAVRYRRALVLSAIERSSSGPVRIVDMGCGQGDFLVEARRQMPQAELAGVDFSNVALEFARERVPGLKTFRADFSSSDPLPAELSGFATHVVCSEVLEHLDDPALLLRKLLPIFAPGGRLIVTVPAGPKSALDVHLGHRRHYRPREMEALARGAGYESAGVQGAGFPFFNLYKLTVILSGKSLIQEGEQQKPASRTALAAMACFDGLFKLNLDRTGLGWQVFGQFRPAARP